MYESGHTRPAWWEVGLAASGRSKCRKCKETIPAKSWRIGISASDEDGHGGGPGYGGWFHLREGCFLAARNWRDIPPLKSANDVRRIEKLPDPVRKDFDDLMSGLLKPKHQDSFSSRPTNVSIVIIDDGNIQISGNTFQLKDQLKSLGGKWDMETKSWIVPSEHRAKIQKMFFLKSIEAKTSNNSTKDSSNNGNNMHVHESERNMKTTSNKDVIEELEIEEVQGKEEKKEKEKKQEQGQIEAKEENMEVTNLPIKIKAQPKQKDSQRTLQSFFTPLKQQSTKNVENSSLKTKNKKLQAEGISIQMTTSKNTQDNQKRKPQPKSDNETSNKQAQTPVN